MAGVRLGQMTDVHGLRFEGRRLQCLHSITHTACFQFFLATSFLLLKGDKLGEIAAIHCHSSVHSLFPSAATAFASDCDSD